MQKIKLTINAVILLCSLLYVYNCRAEEPGDVFSIQFENDFFGGGTDRHFTHGTRISYLTRPIDWISNAANSFPWFDLEKADSPENRIHARASVSLGHNIFTPENIAEYRLITDDRPYAGWLYMGFGVVGNQGSSRYDKLELNIGTIGPLSGAENVQKEWHSFFGLQRPNGWEHQLENELGVVLHYEQARRYGRKDLPYALEFDVIPHFGGSIGNVFTHLAAGYTIRLGNNLEDDFGPPRIRPSLPGGEYFNKENCFNWYLFAGMEGRAVARNIFLDGNTFSESHSVDKRTWVGDLQAGLAVQIYRFRITYTQIFRTSEYSGQNSADEFGSLSLSYQF